MIIGLLIIILLSAIFAFFEERMQKTKLYGYSFICIALILITAFRPIGIDNDSENYEMYFLHFDDPIYEQFVEFSYRFFAKYLYLLFQDVHSIFFLYAILGLSIKFIAFRRLSPFTFLPIVVYMGNYFILHEFTQIRAAIASGLLLVAIKPLGEKKYIHTLLLTLIAIFFHYSSLLILPLFFLKNNDITSRQKIIWALIVPLGYLVYFSSISLASLPTPYIGGKLEAYQNLKDQGFLDEVNVFNLVFLVNIVIYYFLLYMYDIIKEHYKYFPIMIKMMGMSLFTFPALSSLPVLSFRVSELYGISEIILFTSIYYTIRPAWLAKTIVITIGVALFCINVFYSELLQIM